MLDLEVFGVTENEHEVENRSFLFQDGGFKMVNEIRPQKIPDTPFQNEIGEQAGERMNKQSGGLASRQAGEQVAWLDRAHPAYPPSTNPKIESKAKTFSTHSQAHTITYFKPGGPKI